MIVVIHPNPSLDKTAVVPDFALGRVARVPDMLSLAGGKAFNVARALRTLGETPLVVGPLAGHIGALLRDLTEAEGIACDPVWLGSGETRACLTIVDPSTHRDTEVYESGPTAQPDDWAHLLAVTDRHLGAARALVICGSFLPGVPASGLRDVLERARAAGVPAYVDTYGPRLAQALAARPALVKVNEHEAADVIERPVDDPASALAAADAIRARGAEAVVVTLGARGAVGVDAGGCRFAWAVPAVHGLSAVGSGDSFFAGVVASLAWGATLREAVRLGSAAGVANTLQIGAGVFTRGQVDALVSRVCELSIEEGKQG